MKVKCIATELDDEVFLKKYSKYMKGEKFDISVGTEYVVFGVYFEMDSPHMHGVFYDIEDDSNNLSAYPSELFKIIDSSSSKYWVVEENGTHSLSIAPPTLLEKYFHDDLSNGVPTVVKKYKEIKEKLIKENM